MVNCQLLKYVSCFLQRTTDHKQRTALKNENFASRIWNLEIKFYYRLRT
jgi:hypothetical protein